MPAMTRKILLVPDSRRSVGFGHISRLTTLADALADFGLRPVILVRRDAPPMPTGRGRWTIRRGGDAVKMSLRLGIDTVVLDGYGLPVKLAPRLARLGLRIACIDDMGLPRLPLDLIVNPNAHAHRGLYRNKNCRLGPRYALLRQSVIATREAFRVKAVPDKKPVIFVCMGGADPHGRTVGVVEALGHLSTSHDFRATIILGPAAPADLAAKVSDQARTMPMPMRLLQAPDNFVAELAAATVAVVSGGVVLTESIFLGIPAIALVLADNQVDGVAAWKRAGAVTVGATEPLTLAEQLAALLDNSQARHDQSNRGQHLLDGKGARRIAQILASGLRHGR